MSDSTNAPDGGGGGDVPPVDERWAGLVRTALDDPPPADLLARSIALFELSTIDAELAILLAEEGADHELAGVRGTAEITTFTFVAGGVTIELELDGDTMYGQILPGAAASVELHDAGGAIVRVEASVVGTFELADVVPGSHRLVITPAGAVAVQTTWFTI